MILLKDELGIDVVERPVDRTELFLAVRCSSREPAFS